jgi:proteasome lid subunit RPN8/RPN11
MAEAIRIRRELIAKLAELARKDPQRECCGLLAGRDGVITEIFPAVNAASNPTTEYEIAPEELFRLMREIRAAGLDMLGIYHSHPNARNEPSSHDVARAYYPDAAYFIIAAQPDISNRVRAFSIREGRINELRVECPQ